MTLSCGVQEVPVDRGELEGAVRLKILALEAFVKTYGALEATWVEDLVHRVEHLTGMGSLSFPTSNALL